MGPAVPAVPLRPCLAVAGLAALALAMCLAESPKGNVGVFAPINLCAAAVASVLLLAACLLPARRVWPPAALGRWVVAATGLVLVTQGCHHVLWPPLGTVPWMSGIVVVGGLVTVVAVAGRRWGPRPLAIDLLSALALGYAGEAVYSSFLCMPDRTKELPLLPLGGASYVVCLATLAGFLPTAGLVLSRGRGRRMFGVLVFLVFAAGAVVRLVAVLTAPDSGIDLFDALQRAPVYLLRGENPYTSDPSAYDWPGAPFYPPLPLLLVLPARAAGLDARLVNVVCDLVAAAALFGFAWWRGQRLSGALLAAAYLHFPRTPLLMEMAWYEPMLAALLGVGLLLVGRGWRVGYLLLGLAVTGKQYGPILLAPLVKALPNRRVLLLAVGVAAVAVLLPFLLWNERAFLEVVVFWHLRLEPRDDAITLQAVSRHYFDFTIPRWVLLSVALVLIGWLTWRTPTKGQSPAPWLGAALLVFFLCHNQAFINYFYLCQYLLLFGLTDWFQSDREVGKGVC